MTRAVLAVVKWILLLESGRACRRRYSVAVRKNRVEVLEPDIMLMHV